jgi:hypothetical protein
VGCKGCHLDSPDPADRDEALAIRGLPSELEPGQRYRLTIVLSDPALLTAGFMLSVSTNGEAPGKLSPADETTETLEDTVARSTRAGSVPPAPGEAAWQLDWTAPVPTDEPVRFDLWGNAGNDDLSPLGDRVHHRIWQIPASP